uniref:Uncharacterized protein n=1 Tax=Arundo donax TaxID=35708 RepID=A0A0A9BEI0_ARUDO
MSAGATRCWTR